jgi:putative isomerase
MKMNLTFCRACFVEIIFLLFTFHLLGQPISKSVEDYSCLIKSNVYKDYKLMFRKGGGALKYPFLTPGSNQYDNVCGIGTRG